MKLPALAKLGRKLPNGHLKISISDRRACGFGEPHRSARMHGRATMRRRKERRAQTRRREENGRVLR
eukprot:1770859-Pleurochrysis_carterae.AAC.1